jgi:hypothetical protein
MRRTLSLCRPLISIRNFLYRPLSRLWYVFAPALNPPKGSLLSRCFDNAETHQEKVELVAVSKQIIREARKQIAEYRAAFAL